MTFQNPCKENKTLKALIKNRLDLDRGTDLSLAGIGIKTLIQKDLWIGFLKDKAEFLLEKRLYLSSIRSIYYDFPGSGAPIVNIEIYW
ncbi:MAG: hypothetical protein ACTSQI_17945 [Candidatus Helarchaeota archaeon]